MQGSVLVALLATEALHVVLKLGLHDTTDSHDITTYTGIDQVILDLAIDRLRQFTSVNVLKIVLDFLNPYTLVERGLRSVLFWVENATPAIDHDTFVRCLPLVDG